MWTSVRFNLAEAAMTWDGLVSGATSAYDGAAFTNGLDDLDPTSECAAVRSDGMVLTNACQNSRQFVCMCGSGEA